MSEMFIHYIWQYQYFNKAALATTTGEPIHIFSPGLRNTDAGPDFLNAKVKLGEIQWVGNVEIHIQASGWQQHGHHTDDAYDNVILHVVWSNDRPAINSDGVVIPTIELKDRVAQNLITTYQALLASAEEIPCAPRLPGLKQITLFSALDRALTNRLETKARDVEALLNRNNGDWEETAYQLLGKNFGFKVNADPFLMLAQALPYKTLMKHQDKLLHIEAMLFGVAGFLDEKEGGEYYLLLKREFNLLRRKYAFDPVIMNKTQWKFLRLRPANFPTFRIAQFASFLHYRRNLFSVLMHSSFEKLRDNLATPPSSYWQTHYNFRHRSHEKEAELGVSSIENILINTVVPLYAAYAQVKDDESYMDKALRLLYALPSESNNIVRKWGTFSVKSRNAFDSQALLELYNNFCSRHRCLDCNIGASLVKPQ
jgi:hypothetical protein